jgi:hypothetical protein
MTVPCGRASRRPGWAQRVASSTQPGSCRPTACSRAARASLSQSRRCYTAGLGGGNLEFIPAGAFRAGVIPGLRGASRGHIVKACRA